MLQQDMFPLGAVRIPHLEYSSSLLPDVPCDLQQGYIDLTPYELTGTHATLLCHGGHISSCIQAHPFLKDHKAACDMFLLLQYSMPASFDPLLQSIEKTKHVIVVLDQHEHTTYQNYIHSRLREHGISNDVRISLITPDVKNITTHHMHDLYHQAGFSAERLAERIKSL